jgi:hypothetical protein
MTRERVAILCEWAGIKTPVVGCGNPNASVTSNLQITACHKGRVANLHSLEAPGEIIGRRIAN